MAIAVVQTRAMILGTSEVQAHLDKMTGAPAAGGAGEPEVLRGHAGAWVRP